MSVQELSTRIISTAGESREWALERIAGRAAELDRAPRFPTENFTDLADAGALTSLPGTLAGEARLVRAVARADASTARILDGHLNGVERLFLNGPEPLRSDELAQAAEGKLLLGVWGADPSAGEGTPAKLRQADGRLVLRGSKTFCSGAGGVQRALVIAADEDGARRLAYLDTTDRVSVDRDWYRASGLRSSESHRVEFHDTPVLALLGATGELSREPRFSRDAIRTSATWAGLTDCIVEETLAALDASQLDAVQAHDLGRMQVAKGTIDRWLEYATTALAHPEETHPSVDPSVLAVECRVALYESALLILGHAARVCGSRALIGASTLDRARRDLDLFLLQHRLDPRLTKLGQRMLERRQP